VDNERRRAISNPSSNRSQIMFLKSVRIAARLLVALAAATSATAEVVHLDHQHMDFRLQYHPEAVGSNQLDLVLGYDSGISHFTVSNTQVYIVGSTNAKLTLPSNPDFAFLGEAGSPIWILPQSQDTSLPYVGTSAEDLPFGVFDGPVTFELLSVEGPGNFFVWQNVGAGQPPIVKMICTNGVVSSNYNNTTPFIGSHEHFNWGFTTNGLYRVTFRCVGRRLGESTNIVGKELSWAFQILPLRPWEEWQSTNWLPATAGSTNGPAADPDGDGVVNAMEYALGLNPTSVSTNGLPTISFVTDGSDAFGALTFTRVKGATDLVYEPSVQSALSAGDWETMTNLVSTVDNGDTELVTVRDSIPRGSIIRRFYQLRIRLRYP
jgi:surface-anchored protein